MLNLTSKQQDAWLDELTGQEVTTVACERHMYMGAGEPTRGCADCWFVYYMHLLAKTPPHMRQQRLVELQGIVHRAAELDSKGKFDFQPFPYPIIKTSKEN